MERVWSLLIGYLCGCVLTAEAVTHKRTGQSAAVLGTGNPGMANVAAQLGWKWGALVLLGDVAKTVLAVSLSTVLFPGLGMLGVLWAGMGAVLGHNFPFWLHFKGGKGISSSAGVMFALNLPMTGILAVILFSVIGISKYVSLGSITVLLFVPIVIGIFYPGKWVLVLLATIFTVLGWCRHSANIVRLLHGNENKLSFSKK